MSIAQASRPGAMLRPEFSLARLNRQTQLAGPPGALAYLNALTDHRLTVVLRLMGRQFVVQHAYDREGVMQRTDFDPIDFKGSYCELAMLSGSIMIQDSLIDPRVARSPIREIIRSYIGIPIMTADSKTFGSLCHVDFEPRPILDALHLQFMKEAAATLSTLLVVSASGIPGSARS